MIRLPSLLLATALALPWAASPGLVSGDEIKTASQSELARARDLIELLSHADYRRRETATEQLAALGSPVRPVLEDALKSPNLETRLRVRRILSLIEQQEFERLIADFLVDVEDKREHHLPMWPQFRELVGGNNESRMMYVSMLRAEGQLLKEVETNPREAARAFQSRLEQLQMSSASRQQEIDAPSLAAVFFIAADERVPMVAGNDSLLYRFCNHSSVEQVLVGDGSPGIIRKLVGAWIASGRGGYYGLRLAMQYDLTEGLPAAESMLEENTPSYYRQYAILTFAKLGNREHIPRLAKMLNDATVCTTHQVDDEKYHTQFRDIALVAILHLYGQDPKDFGFSRARPHSQYVYSPYTLGFKAEEERAAAFAKWDAFQASLDR